MGGVSKNYYKHLLLDCLCDPIVQPATSICDLLQPFCVGHRRAKEIAAACSDCLFENNGKHLLFLFDGFDELTPGTSTRKQLNL